MIKPIKKKIGNLLLTNYKSRKQKSFDGSVGNCLKSARLIIEKSKYCYLITNSEQDSPSSRMVQPLVDLDDFRIWIGTNPKLRKAQEIIKNPKVTLSFGSEREDAYVTLQGQAQLINDKSLKRKYWLPTGKLFFPNGPVSDDYILICVEPSRMEIMNFKQNVVPEPFGLKPVSLTRENGEWLSQYLKSEM